MPGGRDVHLSHLGLVAAPDSLGCDSLRPGQPSLGTTFPAWGQSVSSAANQGWTWSSVTSLVVLVCGRYSCTGMCIRSKPCTYTPWQACSEEVFPSAWQCLHQTSWWPSGSLSPDVLELLFWLKDPHTHAAFLTLDI